MSDLLFVVKVLVLTVIFVLLMQIKVGETTIERRSQDWIRTSSVVLPLQNVAHGAVKVITQTYRFVSGAVDTNVGKAFNREHASGKRGLGGMLRKKEKAPEPVEEPSLEIPDDAGAAVEEIPVEAGDSTQI